MNRLMVMLGLDAKQFKSGAAAASSYASTFATQLRNSMLAALGPIAMAMQLMSWIRGVFAEAGQLADMAAKFDISTDSLQRMAIVGKRVGLELGNVAMILKSMRKGFQDAFKNETAVNDLLALGFTMDEIKAGGVDAQVAILRLSEALDKAGNKTKFMQRLTAAFGRSANDIMAMLSMSTEELNQTFREAAIMSKEQINAADELGDAWDGVVEILKPVAMMIVGLIAMILGAVIGIISAVPMYIAAFGSMVMGKLAELMEWMAKIAKRIPAVGDTLSATLTSTAGAARGLEGMADSTTQFFGKGANFGMRIAGLGVDAATFGAFNEEKKAKPPRRDTESVIEESEIGGKKGKGGTVGVSSLAVIGGGGLVGGGYDPSVAIATATLDVAKEQLKVSKEQVDLIKNKESVSR